MEDCEAHEYQGRGGLDLDKIVEEKLCQQCTNTGNHVIKSRGEGFSWINKEMQVAPGQNFSHSSCHNNSRPGRCILMEARCWLVKEDNCLSFFYSLWCQHHWMVDPCPQTLDPEYLYFQNKLVMFLWQGKSSIICEDQRNPLDLKFSMAESKKCPSLLLCLYFSDKM